MVTSFKAYQGGFGSLTRLKRAQLGAQKYPKPLSGLGYQSLFI